jgi:hypothetical protein
MSMISNAEREVNQIRLEIHEETKNLTPAQNKARLDNITETTAKKYGFNVIAGATRPKFFSPQEARGLQA